MAARHVLVKNLATIETLGCMSVLCSDKTGTLTEGNMVGLIPMIWRNEFSSLCIFSVSEKLLYSILSIRHWQMPMIPLPRKKPSCRSFLSLWERRLLFVNSHSLLVFAMALDLKAALILPFANGLSKGIPPTLPSFDSPKSHSINVFRAMIPLTCYHFFRTTTRRSLRFPSTRATSG